MQHPAPHDAAAVPAAAQLHAAFRELHADRLHGFALLVTVGDRTTAARLAAEALEAGSARTEELRHPERAAAWLRARLVRRARRTAPRGREAATEAGRAALADLGVTAPAADGLARLDLIARAALIASAIEGLGTLDTGVVVGAEGTRLSRLLRRARTTYAAAFARRATEAVARGEGDRPLPGPVTARVLSIADQTLQ